MKWPVAVCLGIPAGLIVAFRASALACANSSDCIPVDLFLVPPVVSVICIWWLATRPDGSFWWQAAAAAGWLPVHLWIMGRWGPEMCAYSTGGPETNEMGFRTNMPGVCTPEPYVLSFISMSIGWIVQVGIQLRLRPPPVAPHGL